MLARRWIVLFFGPLLTLAANGFWLTTVTGWAWLPLPAALAFLVSEVFTPFPRDLSNRLRVCLHGLVRLQSFCLPLPPTLPLPRLAAPLLLPDRWPALLWSAGLAALVLLLHFWNGVISVYAASVQLGIRRRALGILCGMIPIVNLFALSRILRVVSQEIRFESEKDWLDRQRRDQQICRTRYPLLLVHGVFFRDYRYVNYWGRIPAALERNGAAIFYGNHQSAASVADSARELTDRIKSIVEETGCEKVNIIAHSKGGLDCRYAISFCGAAPYVASLTTINSPHGGCGFADYLLTAIPEEAQRRIETTYNAAMRRLGDPNPDFMAAVRDLTAARCAQRNKGLEDHPNTEGILCQSVGSCLRRGGDGRFPLNLTYRLVKFFDGENDGLVSRDSFPFGERFTYLQSGGARGISHGDVVDLNRENLPDFDVREFYVTLVSQLKDRGL